MINPAAIASPSDDWIYPVKPLNFPSHGPKNTKQKVAIASANQFLVVTINGQPNHFP